MPERHNTRSAHGDACGQRDERHEQHPRHRYHRRHDTERVEGGMHRDGAAQATCDDIHDTAGERHERRRQHVDERAVDCGDRADECRCPRRNMTPQRLEHDASSATPKIQAGIHAKQRFWPNEKSILWRTGRSSPRSSERKGSFSYSVCSLRHGYPCGPHFAASGK